jgi:hypothetical protein
LKNDSLRIRVVKKSFVAELDTNSSSSTSTTQQHDDLTALAESAILSIDFSQKFARVSYVDELQKALGSNSNDDLSLVCLCWLFMRRATNFGLLGISDLFALGVDELRKLAKVRF